MNRRVFVALRAATGRRALLELAGIFSILCALTLLAWEFPDHPADRSPATRSVAAPIAWQSLDRVDLVALIDRMVNGEVGQARVKKLSRVAAAEQAKSKPVRKSASAVTGRIRRTTSKPNEALDLWSIPPSEGEDPINAAALGSASFDVAQEARQVDERSIRRVAHRPTCGRACDGVSWSVVAATGEESLSEESLSGANDDCQSRCQRHLRLTRTPDGMGKADHVVDLKALRTASLSADFRFRGKLDAGCLCRAKAWEQVVHDRHRSFEPPTVVDEPLAELVDRDRERRAMLIAIRGDLSAAKPISKQRAKRAKPVGAAVATGKKRRQPQVATILVTDETTTEEFLVFGKASSLPVQSPKINRTRLPRPGAIGIVAMLFPER